MADSSDMQSKTGSNNNENADMTLTCIIDKKNVYTYEKLGSGSFGLVRRGEWVTPTEKKVWVL